MEKIVYQKFYIIEEKNWWFKGMREILKSSIDKFLSLPKNPLFLDVGCGTGIWLKHLAELGHAYGLDISNEAVSFCRKRGLKDVKLGTAVALPFPEKKFSLVTAVDVIEHIDEHERAVSEMYRVIQDGGYALIITSAYNFLWGAHDDIVHHKRRYLRSEVEDLLRAVGFEVVKSSYINSILFPAIAIVRTFQRSVNWRPSDDDITRSFSFPGFVNKILFNILRLEALIIKQFDFPFGVGILCIWKKTEWIKAY